MALQPAIIDGDGGWTALHLAIARATTDADEKVIEDMIASCPLTDLEVRTHYGASLAHVAVYFRRPRVLSALRSRAAMNPGLWTTIARAAGSGLVPSVAGLAALCAPGVPDQSIWGDDVNAQWPLNGWTPLMLATISPSAPIAKSAALLRDLGADPGLMSWQGKRAGDLAPWDLGTLALSSSWGLRADNAETNAAPGFNLSATNWLGQSNVDASSPGTSSPSPISVLSLSATLANRFPEVHNCFPHSPKAARDILGSATICDPTVTNARHQVARTIVELRQLPSTHPLSHACIRGDHSDVAAALSIVASTTTGMTISPLDNSGESGSCSMSTSARDGKIAGGEITLYPSPPHSPSKDGQYGNSSLSPLSSANTSWNLGPSVGRLLLSSGGIGEKSKQRDDAVSPLTFSTRSADGSQLDETLAVDPALAASWAAGFHMKSSLNRAKGLLGRVLRMPQNAPTATAVRSGSKDADSPPMSPVDAMHSANRELLAQLGILDATQSASV